MYKKLFALFMILSVAVLFTGCSNSNSYDANTAYPAIDWISGSEAHISFNYGDGKPMDVKLVDVDLDEGWEIVISDDTKTGTLKPEDNNDYKYIEFEKDEVSNCYIVTATPRAKAHIQGEPKVTIKRFTYTVNGMPYTYENNK